MPDDGSWEPKHAALCDMTLECCIGRHIFACLWCSYLLYSSCRRHYLSYRVSRGVGVGGGKLETSYCCIRQVCVLHRGDSSLHPSLFFVRPAAFCVWSTSTQIPRFFFFAIKIVAHGASALVAVCRVLAPFNFDRTERENYIYYVAHLNDGSFKCRDRFYLTAVASHFPGARLIESGL